MCWNDILLSCHLLLTCCISPVYCWHVVFVPCICWHVESLHLSLTCCNSPIYCWHVFLLSITDMLYFSYLLMTCCFPPIYSILKNLLFLRRISWKSWHTTANIRGLGWHFLSWFFTDHLPTCLLRIVVCYMWGFVGNRGLQCFTTGTWINYRWAATGNMPECMARRNATDSIGVHVLERR